jgi:6-phosphogluconate dehydrogenase
MRLGVVGLGRMGASMAARLAEAGHEVVAWDLSPDAVAVAASHGATGASSPAALVDALAPPRLVWLMVPAGEPVARALDAFGALLEPGDLLVDGGNSHHRDTRARGARLAEREVRLCDVGVSGGLGGREAGWCLMAGGAADDVATLAPVLDALAPPDGWLHVGPLGAGHYAKMIHNGIEYGLLQAYGEGFELLRGSRQYELDLAAIARLWSRGSVIRSWLLELAEQTLARDGDLAGVRAWVEDSGEGRWTVAEAIDQDTPAPVLTLALLARLASRRDESFAAKLIAALRQEFGGHAVRPDVPDPSA